MLENITADSADGISVVVTCYNLEKYISAALRSVLDQRRAENFEIIVVDDCSTDNSAVLIQSFPEVRYIRTASNGGVLQAMVLGVREAKYDVVALLDGDDVWEADKLMMLRERFEANQDLAFVTHDLTFIDAAGEHLNKPSLPKLKLGSIGGVELSERIRRGILEHRNYVWLGSAFSFRKSKSAFDGFDEFVQTLNDPANCYQDWPFAFWIAIRPNVQLSYIDKPLFQYRLHTANHSGDTRTRARALRNFTRTRNTLEAIREISALKGGSKVPSEVLRRLRLVQSQVDLYSGRRFAALKGFLQSTVFLIRTGEAKKESVRFALGILFGPEILTKILSRA